MEESSIVISKSGKSMINCDLTDHYNLSIGFSKVRSIDVFYTTWGMNKKCDKIKTAGLLSLR